MATQSISKLDAARRQLDTAITLWFMDGDAVSIHTLTAAAHGIIHDLNRANKGPPLLFDSPSFNKDMKKQAVAILKSFENFCKHADMRGHKEQTMEFDPDVTLGFMYVCLYGLEFLKIPSSPKELAMRAWIYATKPNFLNDHTKKSVAENVKPEYIEFIKTTDKREFLERFIAQVSIMKS